MKWVELTTLDGGKHFVNVETIVEAHPGANDVGTTLTFSGKEDATVQMSYEEIKKMLLDVSVP